MNSNEFMTKVDGKDVTFKVNSPSFDNQREAQKYITELLVML